LLGRINKANNWTVPMPNQAQCESEGERFINNKNSNDWKGYIGNFPSYICIKGK